MASGAPMRAVVPEAHSDFTVTKGLHWITMPFRTTFFIIDVMVSDEMLFPRTLTFRRADCSVGCSAINTAVS
jgi:hypothetical protein